MRYIHTAERSRYDLANGSHISLARGAIVIGTVGAWLAERWPDSFRALDEERPELTGEAPADDLILK